MLRLPPAVMAPLPVTLRLLPTMLVSPPLLLARLPPTLKLVAALVVSVSDVVVVVPLMASPDEEEDLDEVLLLAARMLRLPPVVRLALPPTLTFEPVKVVLLPL